MFCNKCGAEIPDDSSFCFKCGNKIPKISNDIDSSFKVQPFDLKKGEASGTKKNTIMKIVALVLSAGAAILVILALFGVFDKPAYEAGVYGKPDREIVNVYSGDIDKENNSKVEISDLIDYLDKSEAEIISMFGFTESETHIYPDDDHIMFWFDEGKVYSLRLSDKTEDNYPDATIYGIKVGDDKSDVEKEVQNHNLRLIDESIESTVMYADNKNQSLTIVFDNQGRAKIIQYVCDPSMIQNTSNIKDEIDLVTDEKTNSNQFDDKYSYAGEIEEDNTQSADIDLQDGLYVLDKKDRIYNIINISGGKVEMVGFTYFSYRMEVAFSGDIVRNTDGKYSSSEDWGDGITMNMCLDNISENGFDVYFECFQIANQSEYYNELCSGHYTLLDGEMPEDFAECYY